MVYSSDAAFHFRLINSYASFHVKWVTPMQLTPLNTLPCTLRSIILTLEFKFNTWLHNHWSTPHRKDRTKPHNPPDTQQLIRHSRCVPAQQLGIYYFRSVLTSFRRFIVPVLDLCFFSLFELDTCELFSVVWLVYRNVGVWKCRWFKTLFEFISLFKFSSKNNHQKRWADSTRPGTCHRTRHNHLDIAGGFLGWSEWLIL